MINFAHRGFSGEYPENTILSIKKAIEYGANGIEIDVHKTKDGKIVVIHDENIERTFNGVGLVKYFTLEQIKAFNNKDTRFDNLETKIPTLEEVLNLIKSENILLNIELKTDIIDYEGIEKDVINMISDFNLEDKVIISSFNPKSLVRCKEINSYIKTGFLYCKDIENIIEYAKELKVDAIHPSGNLVTEKLIDLAKSNNFSINIYTINNPNHIRILNDLDVDGIFTDYPNRVVEISSYNINII